MSKILNISGEFYFSIFGDIQLPFTPSTYNNDPPQHEEMDQN